MGGKFCKLLQVNSPLSYIVSSHDTLHHSLRIGNLVGQGCTQVLGDKRQGCKVWVRCARVLGEKRQEFILGQIIPMHARYENSKNTRILS